MVSVPLDLDSSQDGHDRLFMAMQTKEVWAKIEGSPEVSQSINTFAPNAQQKVSLVKKNKLYEYGYATEIYLASEHEFIYTKITTLSPLYVIVNSTQQTILCAQAQAKQYPTFIKPG